MKGEIWKEWASLFMVVYPLLCLLIIAVPYCDFEPLFPRVETVDYELIDESHIKINSKFGPLKLSRVYELR